MFPPQLTIAKEKDNMEQPKFYEITRRKMTRWGDYGDILQHGMTAHLGRQNGRLCLERTGPFMPPITFPGICDVVVSSACRRLLKESGLSGFTFKQVNKARIVKLLWHEWDLTADAPEEYPESGEPEDYILARRPSDRVAEQMGDIWELRVPVTARAIIMPPKEGKFFGERCLDPSSWNGTDVFREAAAPGGYGSVLVAEGVKPWFEKHFGDYIEFQEFRTIEPKS
jgi:hypothetical protein